MPKSLQHTDKTRQRVLHAALELFGKNGYHGTSMRAIASRSKLALGGIYNHFANKEQIFQALLVTHHPYKWFLPAISGATGNTLEEFMRDVLARFQAALPADNAPYITIMLIELVEFQGRNFKTLMAEALNHVSNALKKYQGKPGGLRDLPLVLLARMTLLVIAGTVLTNALVQKSAGSSLPKLDWSRGILDIYLHGVALQ